MVAKVDANFPAFYRSRKFIPVKLLIPSCSKPVCFLCYLRLGCASDVIPPVFPTEINAFFNFLFLMRAAFRAHFIFLDLITTRKLLINFSPSCCFLCFWSKYFPQTPSVFVFPPEWGTIFQIYKTIVEVIIPYCSITLHVLVLFS